jgi:5-methyltetrahydrofolate--homocysteine methyltransferase
MQPDRSELLRSLLAQRILILDGAMGTMIQRHGLQEATIAARASRIIRRS